MANSASDQNTARHLSQPGLAARAPCVLIVDDDPFMLKLMGQILSRQGFDNVAACPSARAALDAIDLREDTSDTLLLCDLNMPEMDGVELVRHLVKRRYAGGLVLVSGEDERVVQTAAKLARAHKLSVLGYLRKPIAPKELKALIDAWQPSTVDVSRAPRGPYGAEEVREAIARGQLINVYQPKVEVHTGQVVGVETLVRWLHPRDGLVFPDQFIGVAEEHGLIDDLTRVTLTAAFAQARAWHDAGLPLRVAVNVSMDNLTSLDFPDFVAAAAASAGILADAVVLEVTESRLMKDPVSPLDVLTRLRLKHFSLSIDDFGTGYSSLAQLRDLPFDELKVDRSFAHGAHRSDSARAIFEASQSLARQLGMKMVAEGVEDQADWDFLRDKRCDMAQGYFIAKPMRPAELPGWISAWEGRIHRPSPGASMSGH